MAKCYHFLERRKTGIIQQFPSGNAHCQRNLIQAL